MLFHASHPRAALLLPALFLASPALSQRTITAAPPAAPPAEEEDEPNNPPPANPPPANPAPTNAGPPALETPKPDPNPPKPSAAPPNTQPTVAVPPTKTPDNAPAASNTAEPAEGTPAPDDDKPVETTAARQQTFSVTGASSGINTVSVSKPPDATITYAPGSSPTTSGGLSGPPKLVGTGVPIPVAQVPPTSKAPYMQESSLPAGTVFIAVGAILGFFFICVLLWRGLTVWALKRNMKRAAERQKGSAVGDTKQLLNFRRPDAVPLGGYRDGNRDSMLSLGRMPGGIRTPGRGGRPQTAGSAQGHASTLFFSPTAQGAGGMQPTRGSTYLPSGYYAAGSAAPGNGTGMTHLGGNISLSNLGGPPTQGYGRSRSLLGETPPDSPSHRAVGDRLAPGGTGGNYSTSTLDLNQRPAAGRAPSAYLEDLFDEAGATPGNYPLNDSRHPNYNGGRI